MMKLSMVLICVNWSMTCLSTEEHPEAVVGLMTCLGCNMVSVDHMLIFTLSVSVEALEMLCAVVAEALAPQVCDLKTDNLLSPLRLMCDLKNFSLSCIQF